MIRHNDLTQLTAASLNITPRARGAQCVPDPRRDAVRSVMTWENEHMSVWAVAWAWEQELAVGPKLTLLALAQFADKSAVCYPGQATLAKMAGCTDRSVRNHLEELQRLGLVTREHRYRLEVDGGGRTSDIYRLAGGAYLPEKASANAGGLPENPGEVTGKIAQPYRKPISADQSVEPSEKEPSVKKHISARRPETPWPEGLALDDAMIAYARKAGIDPEREFAAWENDCLAHDRRYRDWHHAWRTRIDNALKFGGVRSYGNRYGPVLNAGNALIMRRMEELNGQRTGNGDPAQGQGSVAPAIGGRRNNGGVG